MAVRPVGKAFRRVIPLQSIAAVDLVTRAEVVVELDVELLAIEIRTGS